jgi:hypothetical protein
MTLTESIIDRRQHKRYALDSGGFALIQVNDTEVIGTIKIFPPEDSVYPTLIIVRK